MARNKLLIKKEKTELKQEAFDLKHPRNTKGQFVSKYDAPRNLEYWNKRWGIYPNLGIGEPSPTGDIKNIHSNDNFIKLIYKSIEKGATLIGGCCGSSPSHIRFLKSKMNKFKFYKY